MWVGVVGRRVRRLGRVRGDLVAELLGLADQPLGVAVGGELLALVDVVLAQVVVADPAVQDVAGDHQDRVATAIVARPGPRRPLSRESWAAK
jgi:hypothetical protein